MKKILIIVCAIIITSCKTDKREVKTTKDAIKKETNTTKERVFIDGAENFRDLGGWKTTTGKTVKNHKIFRSNALDDVTENGLKQLEALNIYGVIDFRGDAEVETKPNVMPKDVNYVRIPITNNPADYEDKIPKEDRIKIRNAFMEGKGEIVKEIMEKYGVNKNVEQSRIERYKEFVDYSSPSYSKFLKQLVANEGKPTVFHCAGGKDRAGVAAAFLLLTLDVPREEIYKDYLLTNEYSKEKNEYLMANLPKEVHGYLLSKKEYLEATLNYINEKYGNFDNYRKEIMLISDDEKNKLKELYLE